MFPEVFVCDRFPHTFVKLQLADVFIYFFLAVFYVPQLVDSVLNLVVDVPYWPEFWVSVTVVVTGRVLGFASVYLGLFGEHAVNGD